VLRPAGASASRPPGGQALTRTQPPEDFPRGGPIPVIYAIAPIGFTPANPATLHCPGRAALSQPPAGDRRHAAQHSRRWRHRNPTNIFFFFHPAAEAPAP
jgi:hypothetical protein